MPFLAPPAREKLQAADAGAGLPSLEEALGALRRDGFVVLRGLLPPELVEDCARRFGPVLESHAEAIRSKPNRGPMRHYIALRAESPHLSERGVLGHPLLLALLRAVLGPGHVNDQLASDTPLRGSTYQPVHADIPRAVDFGRPAREDPWLLAVNFPLVDVGDVNGPMELLPGSQRLPEREAKKMLAKGERHLVRLLMRKGDVLVRDVRTLHRGSPNYSDEPRPMVVASFVREGRQRRAHVKEIQPLTSEEASRLTAEQRGVLRLHLPAAPVAGAERPPTSRL